jgi:methylmalonyl-CoA mutase cobalamin-binding domain/chain
MESMNGDRSAWLRCYRCWSQRLEAQVHYDAILKLDPDSGEAADRLEEIQEDVDVVGLSILSGSHRELVPETVRLLAEQGSDVPVVVGGIIPAADAAYLREGGVAGVYTPKDFDLNRIMSEIVDLVAERNGVEAPAPAPA